jgi:hypothetical protein
MNRENNEKKGKPKNREGENKEYMKKHKQNSTKKKKS